MEYRAVGSRCAVDIGALQLPVSNEETLAILRTKGFKIPQADIIALARRCIGTSQYRRGARPSEAPSTVDCSSFVKWLYGQRGVWLPRRSIQQREYGERVLRAHIVGGDLVFVSGWIDHYLDHPADGVGHVGIATGEETVIHAANSKAGVVESSLETFIEKTKFRGARRYIPKHQQVLTLETPPEREVEVADDIRWIVLQSLPSPPT